jgi:hypothetical protein
MNAREIEKHNTQVRLSQSDFLILPSFFEKTSTPDLSEGSLSDASIAYSSSGVMVGSDDYNENADDNKESLAELPFSEIAHEDDGLSVSEQWSTQATPDIVSGSELESLDGQDQPSDNVFQLVSEANCIIESLQVDKASLIKTVATQQTQIQELLQQLETAKNSLKQRDQDLDEAFVQINKIITDRFSYKLTQFLTPSNNCPQRFFSCLDAFKKSKPHTEQDQVASSQAKLS